MRFSALDKLGFVFADVTMEIVSTIAGFSLAIASSDQDGNFYEMVGAMQLSGKNSGTLFISAQERDLRTLCAAMTGAAQNEIETGDMDDALLELVNMVAGNAKLRLGNTAYSFNLTTPFMLKGNNISLATKKRIPIISCALAGEELSLKVKVIFSQYP